MDFNTGRITEFDQTNILFSELPDAAFAASCLVPVFPPHNWSGKGLFMDGGFVWNVNIDGAVR